MYDDRANALKDFKLSIKDGIYPRLGYLAVGRQIYYKLYFWRCG